MSISYGLLNFFVIIDGLCLAKTCSFYEAQVDRTGHTDAPEAQGNDL